MPGGDGTGPAGMGPMTGRAAGFCAAYPVPGYANPVGGHGYWRRGRGGGWGRRNRFYAADIPGWARSGYGFLGSVTTAPTTIEELESLRQQAEFLQNSLSQVNERIGQLEKAKAE